MITRGSTLTEYEILNITTTAPVYIEKYTLDTLQQMSAISLTPRALTGFKRFSQNSISKIVPHF